MLPKRSQYAYTERCTPLLKTIFIHMKKITLLLFFIPFISFGQDPGSKWTEELRMKQLNNLEDSTTWDIQRMKKDNEPQQFGNPGFMNFGAFPVPDYDLLGEFKGVGNYSTAFQPIKVRDKNIVYTSFTVNESPFYKTESGKDRVFFTIITVTDTIDLKQYSTHRLQVLSRNHPDYIGQGYIKTKEKPIDFIAFITPEGNDYAIVNMRLFHLNYGNIIVIAPQKDGTLRSLQLNEGELNSDSFDDFIKTEILERPEIIEFLSNKGVI